MTKDVPPYSVVAGVPARIIGYRKNGAVIKTQSNLTNKITNDSMIGERPANMSEEKYTLSGRCE